MQSREEAARTRLYVATFLTHLHTRGEFQRFAEYCGEATNPSEYRALTEKMIAAADAYIGYLDGYKKRAREAHGEGVHGGEAHGAVRVRRE